MNAKQYINALNARQAAKKEEKATGRFSLLVEVEREDGNITNASFMTLAFVKNTENIYAVRMANVDSTGKRSSAYVGRIRVFEGRLAWYGCNPSPLPPQVGAALKFFASKLTTYSSWHWFNQCGPVYGEVRAFIKKALSKVTYLDLDLDDSEYEYDFD